MFHFHITCFSTNTLCWPQFPKIIKLIFFFFFRFVFLQRSITFQFIDPVALVQCKKHSYQAILTKWIPREGVLGGVPLNIRQIEIKRSFLHLSLFSEPMEKTPIECYPQMFWVLFVFFFSCSSMEKLVKNSCAWVRFAKKYWGSP